jgi:hypothetical protein
VGETSKAPSVVPGTVTAWADRETIELTNNKNIAIRCILHPVLFVVLLLLLPRVIAARDCHHGSLSVAIAFAKAMAEKPTGYLN